MSALSIQPPFPIFTETDGQPLENGYIWIGTANLDPQTNPISVYWDAALTIPAAQPIRTLDGYPVYNGTPARFYSGSDYSIQVQDKNGSTVYTSLSGNYQFASSASVSFLQAGAGAVLRTSQNKMRERISVKDFGAVGDGVTDDVGAINLAIAYANSVGGAEVFFEFGIYRVKSTIQYLPGVDLIGESMGSCTLVWHPDTNISGVILDTSNQYLNRARFENLRFTKDPSITALTTGILGGATHANYNSGVACFENLHFDGLTYGIRGNAEPTGVGLFDCYFKNIWCSECFYGLWLFGSGNRVDHPRMTMCNTAIALDYLNAESYDGMTVTGGIWVSNGYDIGILSVNGIRPTKFIGCWYETSTAGVINILNPGTRVMNLDFIGCMLSTSSTISMFNAANAVGTVSLDRCTLISGGLIGGVPASQSIVRPLAAGGRLLVRDCQKYDSSGVASYVSDYGYFQAVKGGANQSIVPATPTIVTWSAAPLDLGGNFNNVNDSFDVSVPGVYEISAQIAFNPHSVSTNINKVSIYKNGALQKTAFGASNSAAQTTVNVNALINCNIGDVLQIYVEHGNGVAIDVLGANDSTFFDVKFVGAK